MDDAWWAAWDAQPEPVDWDHEARTQVDFLCRMFELLAAKVLHWSGDRPWDVGDPGPKEDVVWRSIEALDINLPHARRAFMNAGWMR